MVRIRLFGGVSAVADSGERVGVGAARSQAVLAALALAPGSAVPVSRLVELVWGDAPPPTAEKTLQWHIAQLRKGLGAGAIVRAGAAYRLDVARDAVDVARFQAHLDAGDLDAALAEWTGTPLAGLDAPGLAATVAGLVERWLGAVEADLARRVDTDPRAAVGALTELAARHPFREGLWALLMTALYRVGRQRDALAAYRTARRHLVEQLGVEPGPRLRELETRILAHDERLRDTQDHPSTGTPTAAEPASDQGNLPHPTHPLIGRERELGAIGAALGRTRLVTLVGPGGIGKTRLALAAARTAGGPRGAWLVELAGLTSPGDVPRAVADALGVTQHRDRTLTGSIVAALRSRPALLLVDNCEHVVDGAAALIRAVTEGCPDVRVLATSRERLRLAGEELVPVGPLDPAGSGAELFRARAVAVDPTFDPDAYRADVEEICRRLDGIPLAIELAAARTGSLLPPDLVARLDHGLRLVAGGAWGDADRHRTLRATFQWSYDLLTPPERTVLTRLSVFAGPFDLAGAECVATDPDADRADGPTATVAAEPALDAVEVDVLLGGLVDRSMLTVESGPCGRRFRLLETVRRFAAGRLGAADADRLARRHASWCLDQVTRTRLLLVGPGEAEGVARLGELWPNLRAAVEWACSAGDPALAHALAAPVATEIALRGRHELADWAERLLATTPRSDPGAAWPGTDVLAFWLLWTAERAQQSADHDGYGRLVRRHGEPDHPLARFARAYLSGEGAALSRCLPDAVAVLRAHGDDHLAAFLPTMSAGSLLGAGRFAEVDAAGSALADRYRAHGPPTLLNWTLQTLGYSASFQGHQDRADQLFDASTDVRLPARTLSANKLLDARAAFRRGRRSRAFRILGSYIDEVRETGNLVAASVVCVDFVTMMAQAGRPAEAARMLGYLETVNEFGARAAATLLAGAARDVPADGAGRHLDDRGALEYMRGVLAELG
ncbi:BTAD domain-containing putative transcriptional regulator [Longispora sp. NPDC051575]|uniref:BTAD domain-containing putative transcriptional regulator n=1 Tax=Longispora sp. NPDC051575 TaxID=3154943 RepID=UPI0034261620